MELISREAVENYVDNMPSELTEDGRRMIRAINVKEFIADCPSAFDGMTNGEVIQALFPNATVEYLEYSNYIHIADGIGFKINRSWWNEPYKAESEEEK